MTAAACACNAARPSDKQHGQANALVQVSVGAGLSRAPQWVDALGPEVGGVIGYVAFALHDEVILGEGEVGIDIRVRMPSGFPRHSQ